MQGTQANGSAGVDVKVFTSNNRGFTPEEIASRAIEKIISIADSTDPALKVQAHAYKGNIQALMVTAMYSAIESYKTTLTAELIKQGHGDMAQIINKI